jgi:hypothetical protein
MNVVQIIEIQNAALEKLESTKGASSGSINSCFYLGSELRSSDECCSDN